MSDDADRFRRRAQECRDMVSQARVPEVREYLAQLARDLDAEADLIEEEEAARHP